MVSNFDSYIFSLTFFTMNTNIENYFGLVLRYVVNCAQRPLQTATINHIKIICLYLIRTCSNTGGQKCYKTYNVWRQNK